MNENSLLQQQFIKKHARRKWLILFSRIIILLSFFILWEVSARIGWIDSFIFSSPSKVFFCFIDMLLHQKLLSHIGITLLETLISFSLVIVSGLLITIFLWFHKSLSDILEPYFVVLNSLPKSALAPLLIVWLGATYQTIIVTGISVAIFGTILSLHTSFSSVDSEKIKLIYTLGGNKFHVMQKVILPFNIPVLFSLMKVNIGLCLVGVIIGEFIASRRGLGYLIIYGSQVFKLDWVIMSILVLCMMAIGLYGILGLAERKYLKQI